MANILFIVAVPAPGISTQDPDAAARWFSFEATANAIQASSQGLTQLARNSWLLPSAGAAELLRAFGNAAESQQFSHSSFFLSGDVTPL